VKRRQYRKIVHNGSDRYRVSTWVTANGFEDRRWARFVIAMEGVSRCAKMAAVAGLFMEQAFRSLELSMLETEIARLVSAKAIRKLSWKHWGHRMSLTSIRIVRGRDE